MNLMINDMSKLREYVNDLIQKNLPIKSNEKSEFGEVFTPISMIETLYERFPKNIWSNENFTWLDPAGGIGNFPLVLFFWLMNGLRLKIKDETKRAKHIIEKMIFISEINSKNVEICKKIFKTISPDAKLNIFKGDFLKLSESTRDLNWPQKFNCVIGNPPYNIGGTGLEGSKRTHIIFTEHALNLLEKNGYLSYICPPSYRESDSPMNELFKKANGHFVFIKIYGAQETAKLFHIQGRVDGFIFQKDKSGSTIIDDEYDEISENININLDVNIPNFGFSIFKKLNDKVKKLGHIKAFRNTEMSSIKANTFGCNGKNKVLHLIVEKGKRVFKTVKKHSLTSIPKLLVNGLGVPYVFYDGKGEYGPSQSPVIILKPSKNIVNFINSDFFPFLAWGLRFTGNNNLPYLFNSVPDISKENNSYKNMDDIKRGLGLTEKEVKFIEEHFHRYEYENKDIIEKCVKSNKYSKNKKQVTKKNTKTSSNAKTRIRKKAVN
jgi:hypothetical protein